MKSYYDNWHKLDVGQEFMKNMLGKLVEQHGKQGQGWARTSHNEISFKRERDLQDAALTLMSWNAQKYGEI